uniref:Ovule protein n=1 Tax=Echinococcus granulosus TaxID=6210 RepID=A0A7E4T5C8_ECHGR
TDRQTDRQTEFVYSGISHESIKVVVAMHIPMRESSSAAARSASAANSAGVFRFLPTRPPSLFIINSSKSISTSFFFIPYYELEKGCTFKSTCLLVNHRAVSLLLYSKVCFKAIIVLDRALQSQFVH